MSRYINGIRVIEEEDKPDKKKKKKTGKENNARSISKPDSTVS